MLELLPNTPCSITTNKHNLKIILKKENLKKKKPEQCFEDIAQTRNNTNSEMKGYVSMSFEPWSADMIKVQQCTRQ